MYCPERKRNIRPNRCLLCPHFGGFRNQGVLCFKVNRWLPYQIVHREL